VDRACQNKNSCPKEEEVEKSFKETILKRRFRQKTKCLVLRILCSGLIVVGERATLSLREIVKFQTHIPRFYKRDQPQDAAKTSGGAHGPVLLSKNTYLPFDLIKVETIQGEG